MSLYKLFARPLFHPNMALAILLSLSQMSLYELFAGPCPTRCGTRNTIPVCLPECNEPMW